MISSQAKEYASVLYELNLDKKQVVSIFDNLSKVLEDKEIFSFFNHPVVSKEEKKKILKESLKLDDSELLYFIYVLVDNNKLLYINEIIEGYKNICDEKANISRFTVTSSNVLSEEYKKQIIEVLEKTYKNVVFVDFIIDNKLIGGIVVKHDNEVIDNSIITKVNELKQLLLND